MTFEFEALYRVRNYKTVLKNMGPAMPDPRDNYLFIIYFQLAQIHSEVKASFAQHLLDLSQ